MRKEDYEELQHLWNGSDDTWMLVQTNSDKSGEKPEYVIRNQKTGRLLLMGDPMLAEETIALMIASGINVSSVSKR